MISIIAAVGKNLELGKDNDLIWHLKGDLKNFKETTMGKKVVMGLNTYHSLPKKLEGRSYIVLSQNMMEIEDTMVFCDFNELLEYLNSLDEEVMIIGGASIYRLFVPYAQKLYLTEIDAEGEADVYFPDFDKTCYKKETIKELEENGIKYSFVVYERCV